MSYAYYIFLNKFYQQQNISSFLQITEPIFNAISFGFALDKLKKIKMYRKITNASRKIHSLRVSLRDL